MQDEVIREIRIDAAGRLFVAPAETDFHSIFRTAMGVHWDTDSKSLFSPPPDEWTHVRWFQQILMAAAGEYGIRLTIWPNTKWSGVHAHVRFEIEEFARSDRLDKALAERKEESAGAWNKMLVDQALRQAAQCWDRGDFEGYTKILAPHRDQLSAAQVRRLEIAARKLGA